MDKYEILAERLEQRGIARAALKKPSKIDRHDTELDSDAADAIQALQVENNRLRAALEPFATFAAGNVDDGEWGGMRCEKERINVWFGPSDFAAARAALREGKES